VPKDYELQYVPGQKLAYELEINLRQHNSVFSLADITEQKWNWEGKKFNGSFSFKTTFGLQGRCIFEGQNKTIQKLVIAKKGSDKLEEGYAVFGCKYGLNALAEEIYDEAVSLPESKRGQYITYKNYNPNSLTISMRKNGDINVNGRIISVSVLDEVLKNAQKQFIGSPFSIFLRIDKDCPQGNTTPLIKLIKQYHFKIYQVFNKEGEYYPIAKQISQVFIDGTRVEKMREMGQVKRLRNKTRHHTKPRSHGV
jgi:biopolymer transport protein ExbD